MNELIHGFRVILVILVILVIRELVGELRRRAAGTDVDGGAGELGHVAAEAVLGLVGDAVRGHEVQVRAYPDAGLDPDPVTRPSQPDRVHREHSGGGGERGLGGVDELGIDGVHQAPVDVARRATQHDEDRDGDEQPDDGIGQREPGEHAEGTDDNGE